jgi:hypothetical protein
MSIGASGSFAGAIVASSWKGRNYLRQLVTPSNPKSAMQTAFRAMFKFLGQAWADLSDGDKAAWETLARQGNYSTFNAYMKFNQDLWSRQLGPVVSPTEGSGVNGTPDTWTATAGVRSVTLNLALDPSDDSWGAVIYMKAGSAPDGTMDEVIRVPSLMPIGTAQILITDLTPGTVYHFKYKDFTTGGQFSALSADVNATPTT